VAHSQNNDLSLHVKYRPVQASANKLKLLLDDDELRERFSREAKKEILTNGHIDMMCKGFSDALRFTCKQA